MTIAAIALAFALDVATPAVAASLPVEAANGEIPAEATATEAPIPLALNESISGGEPPASATGEASKPADAQTPPAKGGDIVVTARQPTPADPLAKLNAQSYEVIQAVDKAFVGPVAMGYKSIMPKPVRLGLRNFLRNMEEPVIALNYVLQLKPARAVRSVGRFTINSTMGVGGLIDVAKRKPFHLPYTPNGFANTFACYGIGPGPYFFLPLIGPTTLRDVIGVSIDRFLPPAVIGKPLNQPYYAIPANVVDSLNDRIDIDGQLQQLRDESPDPYVAARELYLKQRKAEIAAICPKRGQRIDTNLPPRPGKGRD